MIASFQPEGIHPKSLDNGKAMAEAIDFKNTAGKPSGVLEYLEGRRFI